MKVIKRPKIDLSGQRFGRLLAISYAGCKKWHCICDCGNASEVQGDNLRRGLTRSCGCLHSQELRARKLKHGHSKIGSPEYAAWSAMLRRCRNVNASNFPYYGGANPPVLVCDRWKDFGLFLADLGERKAGTTLGRVADVGNYEPNNAFWMTKAEQGLHRQRHNALKKEGLNETQSEG